MSEKISMEKLLPIALELYKTVGITRLDKVDGIATRDEKLETQIDEFVKFYRLLHDKLQEDEE